MNQNNQIIIYNTDEGGVKIDVKLTDETVWLSQAQMADLFQKTIPTINEHIKNVFSERELAENSTIRKFRIVQKEGNREVSRDIDFYNLDVIISVGYRVKSKQGTQFRIWATKTLKEYLLKGYVVNEKRLLDAREKFQELQEVVNFLQEKSKTELLVGQEGEIINLLANYAKTLTLLEEYDKGGLKEAKGVKDKYVLKYEDCQKVITELKKNLIVKREASEMFGNERDGSFEGIIKGLYQTFGGKELYPNREDKAAHLLYLVIKDHPLSDGNKRTGAFLFVYFLDKTNCLYRKSGERKINDNALTALALLIAESKPKEKEVMIKVIENLLID